MIRRFGLITLFLASMASANFLRDCHSTDPRPYIYHGTKTPYELINNEDSSPIFVAGCKPVLFWMAMRHGTQYPPARDAAVMKDRLPKLRKTILQNHKERRGTLCQQDVDGLNGNGSIRVDDNFDGAITSTGREELLLLARRYRSRFAEFFDAKPDFDPLDYQFRHIRSPISQSSARSFSRGIFMGRAGESNVQLTEAPIGDRLVHFYNNCTLWKEHVEQHPEESERELNLFKQSQIYQQTLEQVTIRLGFQYNMSSEDMLLIYDMCRYQKAWNLEQVSPWCAAFSHDNLKVLEYAEDLETYYKQGYGNYLNYKQACPLVQDLIFRIRALKENETSSDEQRRQRAVFYFTEGEGILRLLARMGLAQDEQPPTANDLPPSPERKWRTSLMGSFAANVAVVVYNCSSFNPSGKQDYDLKIQVLVKEELVYLNQCQNALCTVQEFMDLYGSVADQCARGNDGCDPNTNAAPFLHLSPASLLLAIAVLVKIY